MKYIAIVAFIAILGSLAAAFLFMMKQGSSDTLRAKRMATSLAVRVGLSVLLFCIILFAWSMGWITPTGRP